jgi:hypothetical protein
MKRGRSGTTFVLPELSGCLANSRRWVRFRVRVFAMPMQFIGDVGLALAASQNYVDEGIVLGMVTRRNTDASSLMECRNRFSFTFPAMLAIQC